MKNKDKNKDQLAGEQLEEVQGGLGIDRAVEKAESAGGRVWGDLEDDMRGEPDGKHRIARPPGSPEGPVSP